MSGDEEIRRKLFTTKTVAGLKGLECWSRFPPVAPVWRGRHQLRARNQELEGAERDMSTIEQEYQAVGQALARER
jgi:hypothetical protein